MLFGIHFGFIPSIYFSMNACVSWIWTSVTVNCHKFQIFVTENSLSVCFQAPGELCNENHRLCMITAVRSASRISYYATKHTLDYFQVVDCVHKQVHQEINELWTYFLSFLPVRWIKYPICSCNLVAICCFQKLLSVMCNIVWLWKCW